MVRGVSMSNKLPTTRLELIMDVTSITGKEIATQLFIDMSLISRWKNGKRQLNDIDYASGIAGFFIKFNNFEYLKTIQVLIQSSETDLLLQEDLAKWLMMPLSKDDDKKIYVKVDNSIDFRTYIKDIGRIKAIEHFLNIALLLENPCEIKMYFGEDIESLLENEEYRALLVDKIESLSEMGYHITIIHSIKYSVDKLKESIISWMPQYLLDNITIYISNYNEAKMSWHTFCFIEEVYLLAGYLTSHNPDQRYTMLTNDILSIYNVNNIFEDILKEAQVLKKKLKSNNLSELFDQISSYGQNYDSSLFKSDELFFSTMSKDLLEEILNDNSVDQEDSAKLLMFYDQLNSNFRQNVASFINKHIYNYSLLIEKTKEERLLLKHLGLMTGHKIYITKDQYIRHIRSTIDRIKINDYFQIGLYRPNDNLGPLQDTNLWVKEGYFTAIWLCNWEDQLVMLNNPNCVESTLLSYNDIWKRLATVNKDQDHVVKLLEKIIRVAEQ